jgi:GTPase
MSGRTRPPEWERDDTRPRAVLVGVDRGSGEWPVEESLAELERLAYTAGIDVVATATQRLDKANPRTFIGAGKAEEVAGLAQSQEALIVIFDDDLTPRQQANIETLVPEIRILDRTALILEIFAMHAVSREGKLQVELAQLEYLLPRLRGLWGHLERERLGGGRGARFGAGESQLETDRRLARKRIADLKRELKHVAAARETQRKARATSGGYRVALVGYTNAGKSSLLNQLTGAGVLVEDALFATLDPTVRRAETPDGRVYTLSDTVGFVRHLPHQLVEAFRSTLEEVVDADLILHVVDASDRDPEGQLRAVREVLAEIGALEAPELVVVNKTDLADEHTVTRLLRTEPGSVAVSARTGAGMDALRASIEGALPRPAFEIETVIPYQRGDLVSRVFEQGDVLAYEHVADGTFVHARVGSALHTALGLD